MKLLMDCCRCVFLSWFKLHDETEDAQIKYQAMKKLAGG